MKKQYNIDKDYGDKIISVAYGDGSLFDKIGVYIKAYSNFQVRKLLNDFKATAKAVKVVSNEYLSPELLNNIQGVTNSRDNFFMSLSVNFVNALVSKPIYSASAVIVIISVSAFLLLRQPKPEPTYSNEQVVMAEKQVKESFAIVGKILARTQNKITNEVMTKEVARPINKSNEIIDNLFNGG